MRRILAGRPPMVVRKGVAASVRSAAAVTGCFPSGFSLSPMSSSSLNLVSALRFTCCSSAAYASMCASSRPRFMNIVDIDGEDDSLSFQGRIASLKIKSKVGFLTLRQPDQSTLQVVIEDAEVLALLKASSSSFTPESVVVVSGSLAKAIAPVKSCTCKDFELRALSIELISSAKSPLPFPIKDTTTRIDTRLDNRVIDLRSGLSAAVFRLSSAINGAFREFLVNQHDFVEIHTPKLIPSSSEGGSSMFEVGYFGRKAYLAQSPQLYKQMCVMGDLPRVMEVGPVFRAENSRTHRHMTEFVGLDAEMIIPPGGSYLDVLTVLEQCVAYICETIMKPGSATLALVEKMRSEHVVGGVDEVQFNKAPCCLVSFDHPRFSSLGVDDEGIESRDEFGARIQSTEHPSLRLPFTGAMKLLVKEGVVEAMTDDFTAAQERKLGALVFERYGVDMVSIDEYHITARPFYTGLKLDKKDDQGRPFTKSYDVLLRGDEISSGAQRLSDPVLLTERAKECGLDVETVKDYIASFEYGAWPHGGFGIGMERLVMTVLGLPNVRLCTLFPRDPARLNP